MSHLVVRQRATSGIPNGSSGIAPSVTFGSAPNNGNLLLAFVWQYPNTPTANTGWTSVAEYDNGASHFSVLYKYAGASESATQTPISTVQTHVAITMFEVSGVSGTWATDFIAVGGNVTSGSVLTSDSFSFTTSHANELILSGWCGNTGGTTTGSGTISASAVTSQYSVVGGPDSFAMCAMAGELFEATSGTAVTDNWTYTQGQVISKGYVQLQSAAASTAYGQMLLCNI